MAKHLVAWLLGLGCLISSCSGATRKAEQGAAPAGRDAMSAPTAAGVAAPITAGRAVLGTELPAAGVGPGAAVAGRAAAGSSGALTGAAGTGDQGTAASGAATAGTQSGGSSAGAGRDTGGAGGMSGSGSCDVPAPVGALIGWAAVSGMGVDTTSGGGNAPPKTVSTLSELTAAVSGNTPGVVYVKGKLQAGSLSIGSNKTIVGLCGAELHGHLSISAVSNIIVRNLKIVGYAVGDCSLDPKFQASEGCSSGQDAITAQNAHHVWFDHCDVSDGTDGNLDITNGADFVTVSWTRFHYSPRMDPVGNDSTGASGHRFSNLIGGADGVAADVGHLNVTWHHNWWADNVDQRMPRTRAGKIHVLNNLFTAKGNSYCTNAGAGATLLVEGNVYVGVKNPLQPTADGDMRAQDNLFTSTSGTNSASGMGFTPPYPYTAEPVSSVESAVRAGAGVL